MPGLSPKLPAALLQPVVQGVEAVERRHGLPDAMPRILDVLLDLPLLPSRSWITEFGFEQVMTGHGRKTNIDAAFLATANLVHGGAHIIVYTSPRHSTENPKGVVMRIEQHLVGLQQIGADDEGAAVAKLDVRHLQFDTNAADNREILAPVELESFTGCKRQGHEASPASSLLQPFALLLPGPGKCRHTVVGTVVAKTDEIPIQLFGRPSLLAWPPSFTPQPRR
jgi:hypothetical protein